MSLAVGPHHVEVAGGFVLVVLVALQRAAAPLGDEGDVAAGQVGRVQVAPLGRRSAAAGPCRRCRSRTGGSAPRSRRRSKFVRRSSQPSGGSSRLGLGVAEDDAVGVPTRGPCRGRGPGPSCPSMTLRTCGSPSGPASVSDADVAAGPRDPGHVVQADVGIRLLGEPLDEQQLVEVEQRVRERHSRASHRASR